MALTDMFRRATVGGLTGAAATAATSAQERPVTLRLTPQEIAALGGVTTLSPGDTRTTQELLDRIEATGTIGIGVGSLPDADGKLLVIPAETLRSLERSARYAAPLETALEEQRANGRSPDGLPSRPPVDLDRAAVYIQHGDGPSSSRIDVTGKPQISITTGDLALSRRQSDLEFIVAHTMSKAQVLPELGRAPLDSASQNLLRNDLIQADTRAVQALCETNAAAHQDILAIGRQLLGSSSSFPAARVEALEDAVRVSCPPAVEGATRADGTARPSGSRTLP